MGETTIEARKGAPWELLYAADLVLNVELEQVVMEAFGRWIIGIEAKGLEVNFENTKAVVTGKDIIVHRLVPCASAGLVGF